MNLKEEGGLGVRNAALISYGIRTLNDNYRKNDRIWHNLMSNNGKNNRIIL